jgi:hypothetical protein
VRTEGNEHGKGALAKAVGNIDKAKLLTADAKAQLKKAMIPLLKELKDSLDEESKLAADVAKFKLIEKALTDRLGKLKSKSDTVVKDARGANDILGKFRKANTANDPVLCELFNGIAPLANGRWRTQLSL